MKTTSRSPVLFALLALSSIATVAACGASPTPDAASAAASSSAAASATAPGPFAPAPTDPTPEETAKAKAKADGLAQLAKDRAKFDAEQAAELVRWTPALHAAVKPLADTAYANGHEAMVAVLAGKHRRPASPGRDHDRHPLETFDFYGLSPTMTVLEFAPGEGWFTELVAPILAKKGKLIATNTDPNGPKDERATFYGQRFKAFLERSPEVYGKVVPLVIYPTAPKLGLDGTVDMVLVMRAMHGVVNAGQLDRWLGEMHKALKPNGILAIEQHRAKPDAVPTVSAKKGYLPEKWVIERVEAAGFKLVASSEINANPKDTKDYPDGVWTLPPTYRLGDTDRANYTAIGESDRMTLRFVKVAAPAAATK